MADETKPDGSVSLSGSCKSCSERLHSAAQTEHTEECEGITKRVRHRLGTHRLRLLQADAKTSARVSKQFWPIFRIGSSFRFGICRLGCCPKTRRWKPGTNSSNRASRSHSRKPAAFGRCAVVSSFR